MDDKTVKTKIKQNCAYIYLKRAKRLNSFNMNLGKELYKALKKVNSSNDIKIVIITGLGKSFCAGGDVKEMHEAKDKPKFLKDLTKIIHKCVIEMRSMEKPVIAAVNGPAFGAGFSLALACDIIISVENAKFGTAFIGIGLAPGCGTQLFSQIVGYQRACEYILTSKVFNAEKAKEIGLVNKIVKENKLDEEIEKYVNIFSKFPSIAVGKAKMLINKSFENNFKEHLDLESITASETAGTDDFKEGVSAFANKRKPNFKGK